MISRKIIGTMFEPSRSIHIIPVLTGPLRLYARGSTLSDPHYEVFFMEAPLMRIIYYVPMYSITEFTTTSSGSGRSIDLSI
jgi:hypothetical protein